MAEHPVVLKAARAKIQPNSHNIQRTSTVAIRGLGGGRSRVHGAPRGNTNSKGATHPDDALAIDPYGAWDQEAISSGFLRLRPSEAQKPSLRRRRARIGRHIRPHRRRRCRHWRNLHRRNRCRCRRLGGHNRLATRRTIRRHPRGRPPGRPAHRKQQEGDIAPPQVNRQINRRQAQHSRRFQLRPAADRIAAPGDIATVDRVEQRLIRLHFRWRSQQRRCLALLHPRPRQRLGRRTFSRRKTPPKCHPAFAPRHPQAGPPARAGQGSGR